VEKDLSNTIGIVSKRDLLLFMIRNFSMSFLHDKLLERSIIKISLGKSGDEIFQMNYNSHLREIFQHMSTKKLSCVPIIDENRVYLGMVQKWHVYYIFKNLSFHYVNLN
jgi:CBS-domain-containing membrane protein